MYAPWSAHDGEVVVDVSEVVAQILLGGESLRSLGRQRERHLQQTQQQQRQHG